MTRRKKSQQRAGGECSASARGDKVKQMCFSSFLTRARQVFFVFFLHLFTDRSQRAVYQSVRSEGFEENAFTCSVADFAVGEAGRVAREIRGEVLEKSGTFP